MGESWRSLLDLSIHAYYDHRLEAGREACDELLARADLPSAIRRQTRRNQIFYADTLANLVTSATVYPIDLSVAPGWSRFNPSIAADGDGFRLIVRSSNYTLTPRSHYIARVFDASGVIRTQNYLVTLDSDLTVQSSAAIDAAALLPATSACPVVGFEDCRLFRASDRWWASATTRDRNPDGICQIALLGLEENAFQTLHLLSDAATGRHEKNWMPCPTSAGLSFVYESAPTTLLLVDPATGTVRPAKKQPAPLIATAFRGGSQLVAVDDGYLCIVHESVDFEDGGRVYPHRFVRFDRDFAMSHVSPQFFFLQRAVEFCAGLARDGDRFVASFGSQDRDAYLMTMDIADVLATLQPVTADMTTAASSAVMPSSRQPATLRAASHNLTPPPPDQERGITPFPSATSSPTIVSMTLTGSNRDLIGGALNSVVDWINLCLVIDTGATDDTLAVAQKVAGDKYREARVPWTDNFAAARNAALTAATDLGADWAVVVDTDERLDRASVDIRQHLAETQNDVLMVFQRDGSYAKERFFRLPTNARYHGPTHEYVAADEASIGDLPGVRFREIRKCAEAYQAKFQRDVEILTRYTAEHPDDPRWFYYLGDAHHGLRQEENAIAAFMACAALRGWNEESAWACYRAAECWLILDNPIQAIDCCAMGLTRHPGLAELSWLAAYAAWRAGQFAHAAHWARLSIAAGCFAGSGCNEPRRGFRNPRALYEGPYDVLRYALRALGDEAGAKRAELEYHAATAVRVARS